MGVQTVTGTVDVQDLGFTLMHEHVHTCSPIMRLNYPQFFDREAALAQSVAHLREAYDAGVRTIVDPTTPDMGRDASFMRDCAERSGVRIVAATGLYLRADSYLLRVGADHIVGMMLDDVERGIAGTDVRVGMIKCAIEEELNPASELSLRVGGRLHRETGLPVTVHTSPNHGSSIIAARILEEEGVDPSSVVLGHVGDSEDLELLADIAARGYTLGMDRFGMEPFLATDKRIKTLTEMCRAGFAKQMIVSHDCACWSDWLTEDLAKSMMGPHYRMTTVPSIVLPALREAGIDQADIDLITIRTPARLLDIAGND